MADKALGDNVHKDHRERVKNRFLKGGLEGFDKHNILELLLFYSIPQRDTNALAHRLLDRFGSLAGVFDATLEELLSVEGVGRHTATLIKLIPALSREYLSESDGVGEAVPNYEYMGDYFVSRFVGVTNERIMCAMLDNSCRIISTEILSEGGVTSADLPFRTVTEAAIKARAAYIVLAHNHPRGEPLPSFEDYEVTQRLARHLAQIDVRLADHFIVAGRRYTSIMRDSFISMLSENDCQMI